LMQYLLTKEEIEALVEREKLDEMTQLRDVAVHVALATLKLLDPSDLCIHDPKREYEGCCEGCPLSGCVPSVSDGKWANAIWRGLPDEVKVWIRGHKFAKVCGFSRIWPK